MTNLVTNLKKITDFTTKPSEKGKKDPASQSDPIFDLQQCKSQKRSHSPKQSTSSKKTRPDVGNNMDQNINESQSTDATCSKDTLQQALGPLLQEFKLL